MGDWVCAACGAQWAPGAPRCPECPSTEHREAGEVPKISRDGTVSYEADVPRVHPGTGELLEGAEHPADGTMSPPVSNDDGEPGEQVVQVPEGAPAQDAAPVPEPAAPAAAPKSPPRRPPGGSGG